MEHLEAKPVVGSGQLLEATPLRVPEDALVSAAVGIVGMVVANPDMFADSNDWIALDIAARNYLIRRFNEIK